MSSFAIRARRLLDSEPGLFAATLTLVAASRAPFIEAAQGSDPDSWRVAAAAKSIAETHLYKPSRLPGYPFHEIACALLSPWAPAATNAVTALLSAIGAAFFALTLRRLGRPHPLLLSLAFAMTPVVLVGSINTMDYLWSEAFLLCAGFAVVSGRPLWAGAMLGTAVGCRLTAGAMLLPLAWLLHQTSPRADRRELVVKLGLSTLLVASGWFSPVLARHGLGFFTFDPEHPGAAGALKRATVETWGVLGTVAVLVAVLASIGGPVKAATGPWLLAIALYLVAFARLPVKAGYLIPMIPATLVVLSYRLGRRALVALSASLLASSFVLGVQRRAGPNSFEILGHPYSVEPLRGPLDLELSARRERADYVARARIEVQKLPPQSTLVTGSWGPPLRGLSTRDWCDTEADVECIDTLNAAAFHRRRAGGRAVYYLAGVEADNTEVTGLDLAAAGARAVVVPQ